MSALYTEQRDAPPGFRVFGHIYLVFKSGKEEYVIRGGPSHGTWEELLKHYGDPGKIVVETKPIELSKDKREGETPADRGSNFVKLDGVSADDAWDIIKQIGDDINKSQVEYRTFDLNSNSVIATLLNTIGVDIRDEKPSRHAIATPAWNEIIQLESHLTGGKNKDIIVGQGLDDTINGGGDDDRIYGDLFFQIRMPKQTYKNTVGDDTLRGGAGDDFIDGGAGQDDIDGGADDDTLLGGTGSDHIVGGSGKDTLYGFWSDKFEKKSDCDQGDDSKRDKLFGGAGNDAIFAGKGNDLLDGGANSDEIHGGAGTDTLIGGMGSDHLFGGSGKDRMFGEDGNDTINLADDTELSSYYWGHDYIDGGKGIDTVEMSASIATIQDKGKNNVIYYEGTGLIDISDVERVRFVEDEFRNNVSFVNNSEKSMKFYGTDNNDSFFTGADISSMSIGYEFHGDDGNDNIYVSSGRVYGDAGKDTIHFQELKLDPGVKTRPYTVARGGDGKDIFEFQQQTGLDGKNIVVDFKHSVDKIRAQGAEGFVSVNKFVEDPTINKSRGAQSSIHLVYDRSAGDLYGVANYYNAKGDLVPGIFETHAHFIGKPLITASDVLLF